MCSRQPFGSWSDLTNGQHVLGIYVEVDWERSDKAVIVVPRSLMTQHHQEPTELRSSGPICPHVPVPLRLVLSISRCLSRAVYLVLSHMDARAREYHK